MDSLNSIVRTNILEWLTEILQLLQSVFDYLVDSKYGLAGSLDGGKALQHTIDVQLGTLVCVYVAEFNTLSTDWPTSEHRSVSESSAE